MKKRILIFLFIVLTTLGFILYYSPIRTYLPGVRKSNLTFSNYKREIDTISQQRKKLLVEWNAADAGKKKLLISKAGAAFSAGLNSRLFQYWYETDWDYNGTTEEPGKGSIACGYFVTTLLRDMGTSLNRSGLACSASEEMIKKLVSEKNIHRFSNFSIDRFVDEIKKLGNGIYLTGLDNHTGFIVCTDGKVEFIDSGGGAPARVLRKDAHDSGLLSRSKYRVVGKITDDEFFLVKWLNGSKFI